MEPERILKNDYIIVQEQDGVSKRAQRMSMPVL